MQPVALNGGPAPGGGTYFGFGNGIGLNASGQVTFESEVNAPTNPGIFVGAPGSVQAAAMSGNAAPGGGNYNNFPTGPVVNAAGQVAFVSSLTGGSSSQGIFVGTVGSMQAVALQGNAAPVGGNYSDFGSATPALNHFGQLAFYANLTGGSSTNGIFVGTPGAINADALQGLLAPAGNGATFSGFGNSFGFNGLDQVAFLGNLTGTGVTSANNQGLYVASPGGLVEVTRKGDMIDEGNGSGLHTVSTILFFGSGGEGGLPITLSDSGELDYRLTFTDGTSGIFTSTIPVPEPSSTLLTLAGLLAAVRFRKRLVR
jgi:hypothetical protein